LSAKRRLVGWFDHRWVRRVVISPAVIVGAFFALLLSPLLLALAAFTDIARRRRRWPRVRLTILAIGALLIETAGIATTFVIWVATGCGVGGARRWRWRAHRGLMGWYTRSMFALIVSALGSSIYWRDNADLSTGPVVLIARHTSFFDALIPAILLSQRNRLLAHHVVTHGLRYAPCIDIVGHRFPNRFIKRVPGVGSKELAPISAIGGVLDSGSGAIIFPEGTFRTDERFERQVLRLRDGQPELADRAQLLNHVLPPRVSGTHALLLGAPNADLVVCVNTGLEAFGSVRQILDHPYSDAPVIVETWRIPRADIPMRADEFGLWLFGQYVEIDNWVTANRAR